MTDMDIRTDTEDQVLDLALGNVKEAELPEGVDLELDEWVFTNDKANPMPRQMFHILMESAFKNKLGVMHAYHAPSETIHTLIVGLEMHPEHGVMTYPLAKVLVESDLEGYHAPDGQGGYVGLDKDNEDGGQGN